MDSDVVRAFNTELVSLYELRPPISKKKIVDITKTAMKAIKYYKHVVFGVEKFVTKCKSEYKIPGLYCIDSIIRQSRHQFKERDVFAPRFAINMSTTLANLLNCEESDKPKVVRVLNLWKSHEIFEEARVDPWLNFCRLRHGLETDLSEVEKAVKGDQADMSIYTRQPAKAEKRKAAEPQTPPPPVIKARTPESPTREPSDEAVEGGVTERETMKMLVAMGLDLGGMFSADPSLLTRVHKMVNDKLAERREIDTRRQGNIKGLLADFDYSDDDSPGEEEGTRKLQIDVRPTELTKQQLIGMAEAVLRDPGTKEVIQKMHTEHISAQQQLTILTQAQMARVQVAQQSGLTGVAVPGRPFLPSVPIGAIPPVPHAPLSGLLPLSTLLPTSVQAPTQVLLSPTTTKQQIPSEAPPTIPGFTPNLPPPNFTVPPPQARVPLLPQESVGPDQDDRLRRNDERTERDRDERDRRDRDRDRDRERNRRDDRRRERSGDRDRDRGDRGDSRGYGGGESRSKRARHSRSGERGSAGDGRRDRRRSGSDDRRETSRGRDRDRDNPVFKEMERYKRKMGLPYPPKEGHLLIASCTLWFGRIPPNCSEDDIRLSVMEAGEPARVSIIHSRACAYVTMKDRKSAFRVMDRLQRSIQVAKKSVKLNWATGQGLKGEKYMDFWDSSRGISLIPYSKLPDDLDPLIEGGYLDTDSLPPNLVGHYDEHGLKGKITFEPAPSNPAVSEVQLPPSIPSFPFAMSQPPPLSGAPPFFPPGMMPLPGSFPPALHPPLAAIPSAAPASSHAANALSSKESSAGAAPSTASQSASLPQPQAIPLNLTNGARPRIHPLSAFELNGNGAPFIPRGFGNPPPSRFPPGGAGFVPRPGAFRGGRFPGRGGFDGPFCGRPPFPGGQFPVLGGPPHGFFPQGVPPFVLPPPMSLRKPDSDEIGEDRAETSKNAAGVAPNSNSPVVLPTGQEDLDSSDSSHLTIVTGSNSQTSVVSGNANANDEVFGRDGSIPEVGAVPSNHVHDLPGVTREERRVENILDRADEGARADVHIE